MNIQSISRGPVGETARKVSSKTLDRFAVVGLLCLISYGAGHYSVPRLQDSYNLVNEARNDWHGAYNKLWDRCFPAPKP